MLKNKFAKPKVNSHVPFGLKNKFAKVNSPVPFGDHNCFPMCTDANNSVRL